ncbi:MAG: hypothetical protein IJS71_05010 [Clostridia bacterium]|nr:hypothetical protein [Clostridia bacterium]
MRPSYKKASWSGEYVALENENIKLVLYKRLCGYGFGEIFSGFGKLMGVLDHFGEIKLRDQSIPMRLEADSFTDESADGRRVLSFEVESTVSAQKLKGTSFEKWVGLPFESPVLKGSVKFILEKGSTYFTVTTSLTSEYDLYADYIRLLWLLPGEGSFGAEKKDAMLPGVDWAEGREWTSGCDFFKDPWAKRFIPHNNKISAPLMAVSHDGEYISCDLDLESPATRWFNYSEIYPQPVFASPNFIERADNSLIGIMIPDVKDPSDENMPIGKPLELHKGQRISFSCNISVGKGDSLDALVDYVKRTGFPEPAPRYDFDEALDRIANAFNTNLWHEGIGFGYRQMCPKEYSKSEIRPYYPDFLKRYADEHDGLTVAEGLKEKFAKCESIRNTEAKAAQGKPSDPEAEGDTVLSWQKEDGSFRFEPDGRHISKDDFRVARSFIDPMGTHGDTALFMNTVPAGTLLSVYEKTCNRKYLDGALKALDFCMDMDRPEGGDYWETPLHAPNLLAAGNALVCFERAFRITGEKKYREKAKRFLRSLLAFTHIRSPKNMNLLYCTKPCLCSSDWYFANWVRDFVQWEVLESFNTAASYGIRWEDIDPELDWNRFAKGIVSGAFTFMADTDDRIDWRPHNIPDTLPNYFAGEYNGCFADTRNSVTGNIGGMFIDPSAIANAIYTLKDRENGK